MLSKEQDILINRRIQKEITTFLSMQDVTLKNLGGKLDIPFSTVQRDLNNVTRIMNIYGKDSPRILEMIRNKIELSKKEGLSKGGITSIANNIKLRDETGRFTGVKKSS